MIVKIIFVEFTSEIFSESTDKISGWLMINATTRTVLCAQTAVHNILIGATYLLGDFKNIFVLHA